MTTFKLLDYILLHNNVGKVYVHYLPVKLLISMHIVTDVRADLSKITEQEQLF